METSMEIYQIIKNKLLNGPAIALFVYIQRKSKKCLEETSVLPRLQQHYSQ